MVHENEDINLVPITNKESDNSMEVVRINSIAKLQQCYDEEIIKKNVQELIFCENASNEFEGEIIIHEF